MSKQSQKKSYFNTLIFTIISCIVSVILLVLLFMDNYKPYFIMILVLEVGIFWIIISCIYSIVVNESKLDSLRKDMKYTIAFNACPDYFYKKTVGTDEMCSNEYVV